LAVLNGGTGVTTSTGTTNVVLSNSPTLVTPNLGSPASVGTMPAFTLGGTVSGGGNNINNVVIGTSTPLAGAFTTLSATGTITQTATAATNTQAMLLTGATTGAHFIQMTNTSASAIVGVEGSAGGFLSTGGSPYALQLRNTTGRDVQIAPNGTVMSTFSSAGQAVTGTLSATGTVSGGTSGTGYSFSGSAPATSLTLDSSGNLGIGTTPNVWLSTVDALQVNSGAFYSAGNELYLSANEFTNSSAVNVYKNTGFASLYAQNSGQHRWYNAPSGTAGNAISFTQAMTLDASGNLLVGTTSSPSQQAVIYRTSATTSNGALLLDGNGNYAGVQFAASGTLYGSLSVDTSVMYMTHGNSIAFRTGSTSNVGGTNRMAIDSSGIVTMSAYGAGAATFSAAGVISSVSDETWKIKDGVPVDTDAMLKKLEPGYWYYNDEKKETFGTDRQLGFYAQNVNAAIGPEAAPTPEEGKPWGYYDRSVLAVTVMALQKAMATIESLTARIAALEGATP
jgi:hypothetical protein